MKYPMAKSDRTITSQVRIWWAGHDKVLLRIAVALMALASLVWLGYEFWRLFWQPTNIGPIGIHPGAIDLKFRHVAVHRWFAGERVYGPMRTAMYPPASYVLLWPFLGWLRITPALLTWAATMALALGWLVYLVVKESGARTTLECIFAALMPLCMYATGAAIGNGQVTVHVLPLLLAGLLVLNRWKSSWRNDLVASSLILASLIKPTISVPFFCIVLLATGRFRPVLLISSGYIMLTLLASAFQDAALLTLIREWLASGTKDIVIEGQANLHTLLASFDRLEWLLPTSLLVLLILGTWIYWHRNADLWLLMGVTAIVARFWTYHRWYDDLLILLPMVTLLRIAKSGPSIDGRDVKAGMLLGISIFAGIASGGLYLLPPPWNTVYVHGQTMVWVVVLVFLLNRAWRENNEATKMATSKALN